MTIGRALLIFAIASFIAATAPAQVAITGTVVDPSGAAVPRASVALEPSSGNRSSVTSAITDDQGGFRLVGIRPGRYQIVVLGGEAFTPLRRDLRVSTVEPGPLTLQLSLATLQESVEVTADDEVRPSVDPAANLDTTTMSGAALDQMPILDQDFIGAMTQFLDPASVATSGTTIVVDGVEMKRAGVPKSAVQEISINNDPYSAESSRPGRGRIEIITKPGASHLRGTIDFTFRNDALAARSYFAPVKPPEQREAAEGVLSGPIGRASSFLFTFSRQTDDAAAVVHAITPLGLSDLTVATPSTNTELMARVTHDWNEKHRSSFQVNWDRSTNVLQGVGGIVLPQAGANSTSREDDFVFNTHSVLTPTRLNQFQLTLEFDRDPTRSFSNAPGIIVRDAFVGGGAQATLLNTESGGKLNEIVTVSRGKQVIKFGVQIPNLNRRVFDDQTNQGGTFTFATLADYAAGRPDSYSVQQGPGRVAFWWREYGAFVQDQIKLASNLEASIGLRYDWQAFFHDSNNVSPRASLAWAPRKDEKTIVRAGAGVFYDRTGVRPIASLLLHNGTVLRSFTLLNPSYPDPFAGGKTLSDVPTNITELAPDVQIPYTFQYSMSVEQQVTKSAAVVLGYRGSHGYHLFRSVDINAPLPPNYSVVPDPRYGHVQQIRSDGRQRSDAVDFTMRGRAGKHLKGQIQYTWSRTLNDTGGIFWYPANQYAPPAAEWGPADFDVRHRLNLLATLEIGRWGNVGVSGKFSSAPPYNELVGIDLFHTALSNARPAGVGRNALRASGYSDVDLRWSREVPIPGGRGEKQNTLTMAIDGFNLFNHPNFSRYVGNVLSPFFLAPTTVSPGRRLQLSVEMKFGG
jgi:hypothetical protein